MGPGNCEPVPVGLQCKSNYYCSCNGQRCWCCCRYCKSCWVNLVKAEVPSAGCCHRNLYRSFQEPSIETWNLVVEWTSGRSCTRELCIVQRPWCPEKGRQNGWGYIDAKRVAKRATWLAKLQVEKGGFITASPDGNDIFRWNKLS